LQQLLPEVFKATSKVDAMRPSGRPSPCRRVKHQPDLIEAAMQQFDVFVLQLIVF
jgi:hypothetical protein